MLHIRNVPSLLVDDSIMCSQRPLLSKGRLFLSGTLRHITVALKVFDEREFPRKIIRRLLTSQRY